MIFGKSIPSDISEIWWNNVTDPKATLIKWYKKRYLMMISYEFIVNNWQHQMFRSSIPRLDRHPAARAANPYHGMAPQPKDLDQEIAIVWGFEGFKYLWSINAYIKALQLIHCVREWFMISHDKLCMHFHALLRTSVQNKRIELVDAKGSDSVLRGCESSAKFFCCAFKWSSSCIALLQMLQYLSLNRLTYFEWCFSCSY